MVFIHAGALHGTTIVDSCGFSERAWVQQRQDVRLVVRDREPRQARVGGAVVVGVEVQREVRGAQRLAQEAQADPAVGLNSAFMMLLRAEEL